MTWLYISLFILYFVVFYFVVSRGLFEVIEYMYCFVNDAQKSEVSYCISLGVVVVVLENG